MSRRDRVYFLPADMTVLAPVGKLFMEYLRTEKTGEDEWTDYYQLNVDPAKRRMMGVLRIEEEPPC